MVDLQSASFLCDLCDLVVSFVESRVLHFPYGRDAMLARFFIDRPVLAWVISIVIILLGFIAAGFLPIAEYPEITPPTVRVTTKKRAPDILLGISLYSEDNPETGRPYYDALYLSNYATIQIKDAIARVEGVGDVLILGQRR